MAPNAKTKKELVEENEALKLNEARYRALFDRSRDAIFIAFEHGAVEINQAAVELLGYSQEEFNEMAHSDLFFDHNDWDTVSQLVHERGDVYNYEVKLRNKNGQPITCLIDLNMHTDEDGNVIAQQAVIRDITQQKQSQNALLESEGTARQLARENATVAEIGRIVSSSLQIEQVYDRFAEEVRSLVPFDRISIGLVDEKQDTFVDSYYTGLEVPGRGYGIANKLEGSVTGDVVTSKRAVVIQLEDEPYLLRHHPLMVAGYRAGLRTSMSVPLISRDKVIAALHLQSTEVDAYSKQDLDLAQRVASQVAGTIANWLLFSELNEAQDDLKQNEERLRSLVQSMPIPVILTGIDDGRILYVNERVSDMFGIPTQELLGSNVSVLYFNPPDREAYISELRSQGSLTNRELHAKTSAGEPFWVNVSARPTTYDGQEALLASFTDITERKRAEDLFEAIAQSSPVGMFMIQDGKFRFVNSRFLEETGYTEDELLGMDSMALILPEDRDKVRRHAEAMLSSGESQPYEYRGLDKQGNVFWLMGTVTSVDFDGSLALVGSYMNITEQKHADEQFRTLAQNSPVGIFVTEEGKFQFLNSQALKESGYSQSELLGRDARDFVFADDRQSLLDYTNRIDAGEDVEPLEYRIIRKDGEPWWILGTFSETSYEGRPARIGTYMDITDRKLAEDTLRTTLDDKEALLEEIQALYAKEHRRADQFTLIDEVGRKITSILDVDDLLTEVASSIQQAFNYYHVGIGLVEGDRLNFKYDAGVSGYEGEFAGSDSASFWIGEEGVTGWVASTGEPALVVDVEMDSRFVKGPLGQTRSELTVPIRAQGRLIGVIDLQSDQLNAFDDGDLTVMQSLADQTGIAIENARLFETEQLQLEHMEAINKVAVRVSSIFTLDELLPFVVNLLYESFTPYRVNIGLIDDKGEEITLLASAGTFEGKAPIGETFKVGGDGKGICAWVAANGQPYMSNDVDQDPLYLPLGNFSETRSELAVPISMGDQILGILDVESKIQHAFTETDKRTIQNIGHQLAIAIENSRLLDDTRDVAVLEERNRMAREIHDTMAQGFTGIVLQLEAAEQAYEESPEEILGHLNSARSLARECLQEARRSVWNLLPKALEERPLAEALQNEVQRFDAEGHEKAEFHLTGIKRELGASAQAAILRICQESLTNVRKHSRSTEVNVSLDFQTNAVTLAIVDNGIGISETPRTGDASGGGFGINGMHQRARLLQGILTVTGNEGQGTRVELKIPVS